MMTKTAALYALIPLFLLGQESADRIQVTATKTAALKADQAILSLNVLAPLTATLEGVLEAVAPMGIQESDLGSVNQISGLPVAIPPTAAVSRMSYSFTFKVPYGELSATLQKIDQTRRTLSAGDSGMELAGQGLLGLTASEESRKAARAQLTTDAMAQARARADELAKAAGVTLGRLLGVDEVPVSTAGPLAPSLTESVTLAVRFAAAP